MMCFQCEQTNEGKGCTTIGVCGKTPETAVLQDLLVYVAMGVANWAHRLRTLKNPVQTDVAVDRFALESLFSTMTNVNFDPARIEKYIREGTKHLQRLKQQYVQECQRQGVQPDLPRSPAATFVPAETRQELEQQGKGVGVLFRREKYGEDKAGVMEMILYGLKGMCAYAEHAAVLGNVDQEVFNFLHEALDTLTRAPEELTLEGLLGLALKSGETNLRVMELLESAEKSNFGVPSPTKVRRTPVKGKGILVSGHDLKDLEEVLKITEGTGINVYTHGELLPAHGYPHLRAYKHLVGNYGGAWQLQRGDFGQFPGPILMTSNCIIEPRKSYKGRIFTRSIVGWPGVTHLETYEDFKNLVEAAEVSEPFEEDDDPAYITVGFGKDAVLANAGVVIDAVQKGLKKHFFFIGGCDGSEGERNYFREIAMHAAKDDTNLILTAGCGKYRFIDDLSKEDDAEKLKSGILPKVIDMGQCNDSYGAIQVAVALTKALNLKSVNELPLSFAVSWFEQKAVAVLLSLLHLGVKDIRLGPNLPAFITPAVMKVLVDNFQLKPINPLRITKEFESMINKASS